MKSRHHLKIAPIHIKYTHGIAVKRFSNKWYNALFKIALAQIEATVIRHGIIKKNLTTKVNINIDS